MDVDWRLVVNVTLGTISLGLIACFLASGVFKPLRLWALFCILAVGWYTFVYGVALELHIGPEQVTLLLRPFTGVLLFIIGFIFALLVWGHGKLWTHL